VRNRFLIVIYALVAIPVILMAGRTACVVWRGGPDDSVPSWARQRGPAEPAVNRRVRESLRDLPVPTPTPAPPAHAAPPAPGAPGPTPAAPAPDAAPGTAPWPARAVAQVFESLSAGTGRLNEKTVAAAVESLPDFIATFAKYGSNQELLKLEMASIAARHGWKDSDEFLSSCLLVMDGATALSALGLLERVLDSPEKLADPARSKLLAMARVKKILMERRFTEADLRLLHRHKAAIDKALK